MVFSANMKYFLFEFNLMENNYIVWDIKHFHFPFFFSSNINLNIQKSRTLMLFIVIHLAIVMIANHATLMVI